MDSRSEMEILEEQIAAARRRRRELEMEQLDDTIRSAQARLQQIHQASAAVGDQPTGVTPHGSRSPGGGVHRHGGEEQHSEAAPHPAASATTRATAATSSAAASSELVKPHGSRSPGGGVHRHGGDITSTLLPVTSANVPPHLRAAAARAAVTSARDDPHGSRSPGGGVHRHGGDVATTPPPVPSAYVPPHLRAAAARAAVTNESAADEPHGFRSPGGGVHRHGGQAQPAGPPAPKIKERYMLGHVEWATVVIDNKTTEYEIKDRSLQFRLGQEYGPEDYYGELRYKRQDPSAYLFIEMGEQEIVQTIYNLEDVQTVHLAIRLRGQCTRVSRNRSREYMPDSDGSDADALVRLLSGKYADDVQLTVTVKVLVTDNAHPALLGFLKWVAANPWEMSREEAFTESLPSLHEGLQLLPRLPKTWGEVFAGDDEDEVDPEWSATIRRQGLPCPQSMAKVTSIGPTRREQLLTVSTGHKYSLVMQAALRAEDRAVFGQRKVLLRDARLVNVRTLVVPGLQTEGVADATIRFPNINADPDQLGVLKGGMRVILYYAPTAEELSRIVVASNGHTESSASVWACLTGSIPVSQIQDSGMQKPELTLTLTLPRKMLPKNMPPAGSFCALRQYCFSPIAAQIQTLNDLATNIDEYSGCDDRAFDSGQGKGIDMVRFVLGIPRPANVRAVLSPNEEDVIRTVASAHRLDNGQFDALQGTFEDAKTGGLSFIKGAPGTGKSHLCCALVYAKVEHLRRHAVAESRVKVPKIGVTAPSDQAVDSLLKKVWAFNERLPRHKRLRLLRIYASSLDSEASSRADELDAKAELDRGLGDQLASAREEVLETVAQEQHPFTDAIMSRQVLSRARDYAESGDLYAAQFLGLVELVKEARQAGTKNAICAEDIALMREYSDDLQRQIKRESDVFFATAATMRSSRFLGDQTVIDTAILDEAGFCDEMTTIRVATISGLQHLILVGDEQHQQPVAVSPYPLLRGRSASSLGRAMETGFAGDRVRLLHIHYRCHPTIIGHANRLFYQSRLVVAPSVIQRPETIRMGHVARAIFGRWMLDDTDNRSWFIDVESKHENERDNPSIVNAKEALAMALVYRRLLELDCSPRSIGAIVAYAAQVPKLKATVAQVLGWQRYVQLGLDKLSWVHTVDGFQGDEREVMLVGFVRAVASEAGSLSGSTDQSHVQNPNRTNIACTRARSLNIMFGDWRYVSCEGKSGKQLHNRHPLAKLVRKHQRVTAKELFKLIGG